MVKGLFLASLHRSLRYRNAKLVAAMAEHRKPSLINTDLITLTRHLIYQQQLHPQASGDFTLLLASVTLGCKFVANSVRKAGLKRLLGLEGAQNVQGEDQKKLDVLADEVFINSLRSSGRVVCMVTEERPEAIVVHECHPKKSGAYVVVFDPLDGSSNIDCGVSIGTIFGIYKVQDPTFTAADALRPGNQLAAAGYAMYGSSTQLVVSWGSGAHCYVLDPSLGEFILLHENMRMPERANIYSVNEGNSASWDAATRAFVDKCKSGPKPYSLRYVGSMVADVHRTLLYGGVFMYPADKKSPTGKLRLLYEGNPMAYLVEQCGGKAFTGKERVLDVVPTDIHQRVPIFLGCKADIEEIEQLYKDLGC